MATYPKGIEPDYTQETVQSPANKPRGRTSGANRQGLVVVERLPRRQRNL